MPSHCSWCVRAISSAICSNGWVLPESSRAPMLVWVLTTENSSSLSPPPLSRMLSGTAIFPRSCSGAAQPQQFDVFGVHAQLAGQCRREPADALGVLHRVVVAEVRGA